MILGFNENVMHKGKVYHIQTEDGGRKNPVITTLLFKEGIIIASKRTGYADIIKSDKLNIVVKEIMVEQHAAVLKNLKDGMYDKKEPVLGSSKEERISPQVKSAEKVTEKKGGPLVSEKSLDDIILEYLSMSDKE